MKTKSKLEYQYWYLTKYTKTKILTEDKERHYVMIKWSIQEENITFVYIYAPNIGASKYVKHILTDIKEEIDK